MRDMEQLMDEFSTKHPVWFWILIRLAVVVCYTFAIIAGVFAFIVAVVPLGGVTVWVWALLPVLVTACWTFGAVGSRIYNEYVERWW